MVISLFFLCTGLKTGGKATVTTGGLTPQQAGGGQFKPTTGQDLSTSYANNFKHDLTASGQSLGATSQNIESLLIHAIYKKFVSRMTQKMPWLKSAENAR